MFVTGEGATGTLTLRGPGKSGRAWSAFPGRPKLPTGEAGFQSPGGPPGGGAGENPPGRHPEWLISADESLFSFRLNTLNRAPSDVYLHSLRANAGEGRGAGATRGLGGAGGKLGAASAAGKGGYFPDLRERFPCFPRAQSRPAALTAWRAKARSKRPCRTSRCPLHAVGGGWVKGVKSRQCSVAGAPNFTLPPSSPHHPSPVAPSPLPGPESWI